MRQKSREELVRMLGDLGCYFMTGPEEFTYQYLSQKAYACAESIDSYGHSKELVGFSAALLGYLSLRKAPLIFMRTPYALKALKQIFEAKPIISIASNDARISDIERCVRGLDLDWSAEAWESIQTLLECGFTALASIVLEPVTVAH